MHSYRDFLDQGWQRHTAERTPDAPTVVSLFAGSGGSSLGYSMADYRELLAVEWDDNAVAVFKANFSDVNVWQGDIKLLANDEALRLAGVAPGELDVLDGSPPCQGFSQSGKRQIEDDRNQLFREHVRLLRAFQPKVFVMENVSGMLEGKMKLIFADVMRELKGAGYRVSCRLLNAMYFDVPQSRERVIFIGVREDLASLPSHPKAATRPVTVRQGLMQLPEPDESPRAKVGERVVPMMRRCKPGVSLQASIGGPRYYSWIKADWNRPCKTIHKTVCFGGFAVWHPDEERALTGREIARLGGWPDQFQFLGDFDAWVARIGNAVPPPFMWHIARHVRTQILDALDAA